MLHGLLHGLLLGLLLGHFASVWQQPCQLMYDFFYVFLALWQCYF